MNQRRRWMLWIAVTVGLGLSLLVWGGRSRSIGSINPGLRVSQLASAQAVLNVTMEVGTEVASWFLFHPDDLAYRRDDPPGWCYYGFTIRKDFAAGNLVAIGTAGDGGYTIRFTNRGLTESERQYSIGSQSFRLQVRHGKLYLDGGDALPDGGYRRRGGASDLPPQVPDHDPQSWLTVPNGNYRVTVHTFDFDRAEAAQVELPSYTVAFQPVASLEQVDPPTTFPDLVMSEGLRWVDFSDDNQPTEEFEELEGREFPLLVQSEVTFPFMDTELDLTQHQYQQFTGLMKSAKSPDRVAIATATHPGALVTLLSISGIQFTALPLPVHTLSGQGRALGKVVRTFEHNGVRWVEVAPYHPDPAAPDPAAVKRLQALFAKYAKTRAEYRQRVAYPGFYAEEVAATETPRLVAWRVANALVLPLKVQQELLGLSDRLNGMLTQMMSEVES